MTTEKINELIKEWKKITAIITDFSPLPFDKVFGLMRDTYKVLTFYHKDALIPKELCKLFSEISTFVGTAYDFEGQSQYPYYAEYFRFIADSLKEGFFHGNYIREYPEMLISDPIDNFLIINFEENTAQDYIVAMHNLIYSEPCD